MAKKSRDNNQSSKQKLFGVHAVVAALKNPKRTGASLFITRKAFASFEKDYPDLAKKPGSLLFVTAEEIDARLGSIEVHQGILLEIDPLPILSLEELADQAGENETILLLDQVTDPHNVGAIMRSAAAFGVTSIVMTEHHGTSLTPTLAKCASGALEHVLLGSVGNLKQGLDYLKSQNFWCVGLDEEGTQELQDFKFEGRIALVLGAEGKGLRRLTKDTCDVLLRLPTSAVFSTLNVSNAAAVTLYEIFCQATKRRKNT
jgi:23S rRNA (guanosine2251-2'-O)-methyltransferase